MQSALIRVHPRRKLTLCLLHFFNQRWNNVEQIADHAVIRDFENRRFGVFVDGDDGARTLHAYNMLNGAADAQSEIKFGRDCLPGAADLAVHGQPAGVADWPRGRQLATESIGKLFGEINILLLFNSAADGDDDLRLAEVHRLLGFLEPLMRFGANGAGIYVYAYGFHRSGRRSGFSFVAAKSPILESSKVGRLAGKADISGKFSLEHLAGKQKTVAVFFVANAIWDQAAPQRGRQLGGKVAHLISVRHEDQMRLLVSDELLERGRKAVGRVIGQGGRFDGIHLRKFLPTQLGGGSANSAAGGGGLHLPAEFSGDGLRAGNRLPGDAIQFSRMLLGYNQNGFRHRLWCALSDSLWNLQQSKPGR